MYNILEISDWLTVTLTQVRQMTKQNCLTEMAFVKLVAAINLGEWSAKCKSLLQSI